MNRLFGYLALAAFILTIPLANWMLGNVGTFCAPQGPCVIPVGFGLEAPSAVLMIGLGLVLRDVVHRMLGWQWAMGAIVAGAALSAFIAAPALVVASAAAFLLSETTDLLVYAPLQRRHLTWAVVLSGVVGALVDSAVFLLLAFGSLDFFAGQMVGKLWMTLLALPVLMLMRAGYRKAIFG